MHRKFAFVAIALLGGCIAAKTQQPNQLQLKIDSSNRTIAVSAEAMVNAEPDIAVLCVGFVTKPTDAKTAYANGAVTSNAIIAAIKQAGIPESAIHSESQRLEPVDLKIHKFKLEQEWTVKVPPARAGEILDIAVNAGASDSGDISWSFQDEQALNDRALEKAAARARSDAEALAKVNGVRLGALLYLSNNVSASEGNEYRARNFAMKERAPVAAPRLAIEPDKVSRTAEVYAVFAIE
jgi:hypothetical protein